MIIDAELEISEQVIEADFSVTIESGSGDYDEGYADGYEEGKTDTEVRAIALVNEGLTLSDLAVAEVNSLEEIPEKVDEAYLYGTEEGYESGKKAQYDAFWDAYQQNGNRTNYNMAFGGVGWTDETFKPKYPIAPVGNAATENTFYASEITNIPDGLLDFSQVTYCYMTFRLSKLITAPPLDLSNCANGTIWLFGQCANLKEIKTVTVSEQVTYSNFVFSCAALEKITFAGTIGQALNFQWSPLLTNESVQSIIDHLKDLTGATAQTLTFHATVGANLTDEQKAAISAKNWTLAY